MCTYVRGDALSVSTRLFLILSQKWGIFGSRELAALKLNASKIKKIKDRGEANSNGDGGDSQGVGRQVIDITHNEQ